MTSIALWKPEDLKLHQRGEKSCWQWLGLQKDATEALRRFRERNPTLTLEARLWPSGEAWEPVEARERLVA